KVLSDDGGVHEREPHAKCSTLSGHRKEVDEFISGFMSWKAVEPEITQMYKQSFTESELKELIAFYQTPIGVKVIRLLPELSQKGMEIAQRRLTENMTKLSEFAKKYSTKKGAS